MASDSSQYFERVQTPQQYDFLKAQNNCILCCTVLELQHIRLDHDLQIEEQAHCPECELKARKKIHPLN